MSRGGGVAFQVGCDERVTAIALTSAIRLREFPEIEFTEGPTGRRATMRTGLDVWGNH